MSVASREVEEGGEATVWDGVGGEHDSMMSTRSIGSLDVMSVSY